MCLAYTASGAVLWSVLVFNRFIHLLYTLDVPGAADVLSHFLRLNPGFSIYLPVTAAPAMLTPGKGRGDTYQEGSSTATVHVKQKLIISYTVCDRNELLPNYVSCFHSDELTFVVSLGKPDTL